MQTPIILDGKALADKICANLKLRVNKLKENNINPTLIIVTTGNDAASTVYVRNKKKRGEEIGINIDIVHFNDLTRKAMDYISYKYNPTIVQMPFVSSELKLENLNSYISALNDVDGFVHNKNVAALANGSKPFNYPCTPKGIMRLMGEYAIPIEGKSVCVIGRSNIVGRPIARMMEQVGGTVTVCHSKTPEHVLYKAIENADIIISATGVRNIISFDRGNIVSRWNIDFSSKVFIDVGINHDENGKLCGDIDPKILNHCYAYTPVPGGVGPMTVAMLMENVVEAYESMYYLEN